MIDKSIGWVITFFFAIIWFFVGDNLLIANMYLAASFVILSNNDKQVDNENTKA